MELLDVETADDAETLMYQENFWSENGEDALFFCVDGYFVVVILWLTFWLSFTTLCIGGGVFLMLLWLRKQDISLLEFVSRVRLVLAGKKYKRL
ncbi:hypothetical protein [Photobacterium damselae]|uniref:hypothetical protein n=1 Tax=Photobacterium damselae TaxID=38293 RepID=UPI001F45C155|nr:hypothetical protein [Photobacterium damselae]UKA04700.1 hypothetical protein IHC89_20895 [Photobacterium damselae subsp. damselae]